MSTTFFDNTNPLPPIGNNTRPFPGTLAASFSVPVGNDWTLTSLGLVLVNNGIVDLTAKISVDLYSAILVGGWPAQGPLVANLAVNDTHVIPVANPVALVNIALAANPQMSAGGRFWIVVSDPTNSGFGWKFTSPWNSAGTGVVTEFNSGAGGPNPPDANPADFFSNDQLSPDPNGTSAPYYMIVTGDPVAPPVVVASVSKFIDVNKLRVFLIRRHCDTKKVCGNVASGKMFLRS